MQEGRGEQNEKGVLSETRSLQEGHCGAMPGRGGKGGSPWSWVLKPLRTGDLQIKLESMGEEHKGGCSNC